MRQGSRVTSTASSPVVGNGWDSPPYTWQTKRFYERIDGPSKTRKNEFNPVQHYTHTVYIIPFNDVGIPGDSWDGHLRTNMGLMSVPDGPLVWDQNLRTFSRKEYLDKHGSLSGDNLLNSLRELTEVPQLTKLPKRPDSAYLYKKFGIDPLFEEWAAWKKSIGEFEGIFEKLLSNSGKDVPVKKTRTGQFRKYITTSAGAVTMVIRLDGEVFHRGTAIANYTLSGNNPFTKALVALDRSGLLKVPSTLFQAQKLSFVLDWFVRVSKIISELDPEPIAGQLKLDRFAGSMKVVGTITGRVVKENATINSRWVGKELLNGTFSYYLRGMSHASPFTENLFRNPFQLEKESDAGKLFTLAALTSQMLVK